MNQNELSRQPNVTIIAPRPDSGAAAGLLNEQVPVGTCVMNFSPSDQGIGDVLFALEERASREPLQHVAEPFRVRWWSAKKIELADDQTGEVVSHVRLALASPDGDTLSFVSVGAVVSWDLIRAVHGDGPYDPALPVLVKPEKTRGGFTTYRLRPAPQQSNQ